MELHRTEHLSTSSGQLVEVRYLGIAAHSGEMRDAILNLKYHQQRTVAKQLAHLVATSLQQLECIDHPCVVTWAPTTQKRIRRRGFDHAELIARHVGAYVHAPVRRLLRRTNVEAQTGRSRSDRLRAVSFVGRRLNGEHVVVIDDVTTTGATFRAAATELVRCGAGKVTCVAPSRTMNTSSHRVMSDVTDP